MHNYKYLVNEWQELNVSRESYRKRMGKTVRGLELEEDSQEGHGFYSWGLGFTSTCAGLVYEPTVHAVTSSNRIPN